MIKNIIFIFLGSNVITHFIQYFARMYLRKLMTTFIEIDYFIFNLISSILAILIYYFYGNTLSSLLYILTIYFYLLVFIIDAYTMIIPDITFLFLSLIAIIKNIFNFNLLNFVIVVVFIIVLTLINILFSLKKGIEFIGYGDIKLFLTFGLITSMNHLIAGIMLACYMALLWEIIVKKKRNKIFPFGPYLVLCFIFSLLLLKLI